MQSLMKNTAWAAVVLLAGPLYCGAASAQEMETSEITVTATRTEKNLMEVPMSVGVVGAEDLKREPATNVADALSGMPGVTVMDGGMPGGKRVMIRGESPMRSLILIDGVKVSEQKSMSGSAIMIDTSQIERIEVIKGPASVLYGSEAIGGVVNIITKKGGEKPVSFSQNFIIDSSTESVDIQSAIFGSYNGFNYRFSASGIDAGRRKTGSGTLDNSEYQNRYYSGQVGYDWDNGSFFVRADRYESQIDIPTNTVTGQAFSIRNGQGIYMDNQTDVSLNLPRWDRESLTAGLELRDLTDNLTSLKFNAYMQNMKKDFRNNVHVYNAGQIYMPIPMPGWYDLEVTVDQNIHTYNDQDSFGGNIQSEWSLGGHYIIAGADYNKDKLSAQDNRLGGYALIQSNNPMIGTSYTPEAFKYYRYKVEQSTLGLFVQDEWTVNPDWALTLGLRNTWIDSSLKQNNNPDLPSNRDISDSRLVGNFGVVYSGIEDWSLRAMWAQGYRFPLTNQLYLGTVHGQTSNTLPNPDLDPETSNNYEIGTRYMGDNWNLDVTAFYSDAKNYITSMKIDDNNDQFVNMDKARTYGLELGVDYTFENYGLTPYASATWMHRRVTNTIDAKTITGPASTAMSKLGYSTSDTGAVPFFGRLGVKWQADVTDSQIFYTDLFMDWAASTKEYRYDNTYVHQRADGSYNYGFVTDKHEGWQTLNLTLGTQWSEEHKWNASLSLRNITDRAYTRADNTIEDPGFHVVVGVGFEY